MMGMAHECDKEGRRPMNGMNDGGATVNQDVSTTTITYSVMHPTSLDPAKMSDIDIANHMTSGEFLGTRVSMETEALDPGKVDAEVEARGGMKGFFADSQSAFDK